MRRLVLVPHPGGLKYRVWGCSSCGFTTKLPRAGMFGNTSQKSRAGAMRSFFNRHSCERHPRNT